MSHIGRIAPFLPTTSALTLAHRLLALAEDVDRAGLRAAAEHLIDLAHDVFDLAPPQSPA